MVYESTRHEPREAELLDIGTGGLFIPAVAPLPRGTRLAMEIRLTRGGPAWSALGRVLWTRVSPAAGRPSGMGVKIVDIDEAAVEAIKKAVGPAAPARERTVRGIGTPTPPTVWVAKAPTTGRRRGRATAAALLVAAAVAATVGAVQWRMHGTRVQAAAAATAVAQPSPPALEETQPAALAPPAVSAGAASAGSVATASSPTEVAPRAPASTNKPASRRPPSRGWTASSKRPSPASSDNPY